MIVAIASPGRDTADARAALIAARLAVVPEQVNLGSQCQLIARLNSARMFNPGLRVLFVLVGVGMDALYHEVFNH